MSTLSRRSPKGDSKEENKEMAKKRVKFQVTDGVMPKKSSIEGGPFELRLPMTVNVGLGGASVKLGVVCPTPCVVVRNKSSILFGPGAELSVFIEGRNDGVQSFSQGEVIAHVFVIDNTDMVVE